MSIGIGVWKVGNRGGAVKSRTGRERFSEIQREKGGEKREFI